MKARGIRQSEGGIGVEFRFLHAGLESRFRDAVVAEIRSAFLRASRKLRGGLPYAGIDVRVWVDYGTSDTRVTRIRPTETHRRPRSTRP